MPTYCLLLEYRGDDFEGWQIQRPGSRTIQGCLAEAIERLTGELSVPRGSGRTDAGVHAEGQVASFVLRAEWESQRLGRALNGVLPRDVAVRRVARVSDGFDALRDASGKCYRYRIWNCPNRSPLHAARFAHVPQKLDTAAMQGAAGVLVGEHDFRCFQAAGSDTKTTVRTIHSIRIEALPEGELQVVVEGSGFLRHMVRNLVGTLLEVGQGRRSAASMHDLLASRDRRAAGPTAPAHGLTLERVFYGKGLFDRAEGSARAGHSTGKNFSPEPREA